MANKAPSKKTTVREQATKAQAKADKPQGNRRLQVAATNSRKPFAKVGKIFDRQPFRFIGRILYPRFARNAIAELKLVTWPNRRETTRLTFAVIMFAIAFGAIVTVVDYGLDKLFKALILN